MIVTRFAGRFIRVTTEQQRDRIIERAYVRDGVSVIPWASGHIRCIREFDPAQNRERIKLVSGWLEDGEDPLNCAQRELAEELGIQAAKWMLLHAATMEGAVVKTQYFYVASELAPIDRPASPVEHVTPFDLSLGAVRTHARDGSFGWSETAFALLRFMHLYAV